MKEAREQGGTGGVRKVGDDGGKERSGTGGERESYRLGKHLTRVVHMATY